MYSFILWNDQQMQQCAVSLFSASPLYMFRALHTPIIRSTGLTVSTVIGTIIGQAQIVPGTAYVYICIVSVEHNNILLFK